MKTKKGFTLIELMVAMGIIAVLVTMSVVAIQIVQRSLRDTQRRDVINTVNLWLAGHYNDEGSYPTKEDLTFESNGVFYRFGTANEEQITDLSGATVPSANQDSSTAGTAYCYTTTNSRGAFQLAVKLESGSDVQLGNDGSDCTNFTPW